MSDKEDSYDEDEQDKDAKQEYTIIPLRILKECKEYYETHKKIVILKKYIENKEALVELKKFLNISK
jgi:hypothetical protein|uniref:Uncharacterized protein n=1 Tax=viral metagenome TaxID=1070528 RepID=A0A6C0CZN3_9ZZZZ